MPPKTAPFDRHLDRYEEWFTRHKQAYRSELEAVRAMLPAGGRGVEIGVGTGRFAAPLGLKIGLEPSPAMGQVARERGIEVIEGVAEALPFADGCFDFALMVTTVCFVDDIERSFKEALRVLKPAGAFIIGFIDRKSPLGKIYQQHKAENVFYRLARFYSTTEIVAHLEEAGFSAFSFSQTIFQNPDEMSEVEPVKEGYGEGSFVVVRALK
ncbi:MAG: methyltransferase domain-containing protein [Deltaproteobacteria bacterium]|nr:methyltransferase domain-containing protein [Deltaproteobacteria bacterium]